MIGAREEGQENVRMRGRQEEDTEENGRPVDREVTEIDRPVEELMEDCGGLTANGPRTITENEV